MAGELKDNLTKVINFIKRNGWWMQYLCLLIIILIGIFIRIQPIPRLIDYTTGKYISVELDSTFFYRYAQDIAQNGSLSGIDMMRSAPLGQPVGFFGFYTSYFVAYLWKILHFFNSNITVEYVDLLYPIIAMAIMSLFFFLLLRKLLGYKVGLLATLLINIMPAFLFRSVSSDHDILGMMFIIMSFYFYFVALDTKKLRNNILSGVIVGVLTYLAIATAGSGRFILTIIGLTSLVTIIVKQFRDKDLYILLSWLLSFSLLSEFAGISISSFIGSITTAPAYFALLVALFDFVLFKKDYFKIKDKIGSKLPSGIISTIIALVFGSIFVSIFFGISVLVNSFASLYNNIFYSFGYGRIALTVAENQRPYVVQWFSQFGKLYVLFFIVGAILLFFKAVKPIKEFRKKLTIVFTIFMILYTSSRFAPNTLLDGQSYFSKFLFFISLITLVGYFLYVYFKSFYHGSLAYKEMSNIDSGNVFLLIWSLVMIVGATSAMRLFFEFSPTLVILSSFFIVFMFDYFTSLKEKIFSYLGILVLILILFSPFSFAEGIVIHDYKNTFLQSKFSSPGYNQQWQIAGKWVRDNTPSGSIFVHWWDYGYWVQSGFQRPTVTDGGNLIGWWDYLTGRYLLTAQNLTEPLAFLKAHNVSYILMIADEIGKYPAYSSIGSDKNYDRYSYLSTFVLDPNSVQETRNGTMFFYRGAFPLDENFVYNGKVYPANQAIFGGVFLPFTNVNVTKDNQTLSGQVIGQPNAILFYGNERISLPIRCVYKNNRVYTFENYAYDGCFMFVPIIEGQQVDNLGAGMFISKRIVHTLFARLFFFNEQNPYYELVYDGSDQVPLAFYQGSIIGPIKIWKVNYPSNLTLTEEEKHYYLRLDYADSELTRPR